MSKQQTAVDYLIEKLIKLGYLHSENYGQSQVVKKEIEQSKAMEKYQIIKAHFDAQPFNATILHNAEQYYKETYR